MKTLILAIALVFLSAVSASAQSVTLQSPFTAVRMLWESGGLFTDSYAVVIDAVRAPLGKPAATGQTYSVMLPAAALAALTVGSHALRVVAIGPSGEASGPVLTIIVAAPGGPPSTPGLPRIEVVTSTTVTVTP